MSASLAGSTANLSPDKIRGAASARGAPARLLRRRGRRFRRLGLPQLLELELHQRFAVLPEQHDRVPLDRAVDARMPRADLSDARPRAAFLRIHVRVARLAPRPAVARDEQVVLLAVQHLGREHGALQRRHGGIVQRRGHALARSGLGEAGDGKRQRDPQRASAQHSRWTARGPRLKNLLSAHGDSPFLDWRASYTFAYFKNT